MQAPWQMGAGGDPFAALPWGQAQGSLLQQGEPQHPRVFSSWGLGLWSQGAELQALAPDGGPKAQGSRGLPCLSHDR